MCDYPTIDEIHSAIEDQNVLLNRRVRELEKQIRNMSTPAGSALTQALASAVVKEQA